MNRVREEKKGEGWGGKGRGEEGREVEERGRGREVEESGRGREVEERRRGGEERGGEGEHKLVTKC